MRISFGGINTGLPPNIVEQIVEAESIPIKNLEERKSKTQSKLELLNQFDGLVRGVKTSLDELAGTRGFRDTILVSSNPAIISGVVDPSVVSHNANFNIEVIQLAEKASAITNGFPDKDRTEVGIGYMEFETPDGEVEVYIDGDNNTLEGVMRSINEADVGLRASIIKDKADEDNPFRLVLSGTGVGDDDSISYPALYFLDGDTDFFFDEEKPARNGIVKVDGFEFEIDDNVIEDLIPGVTVELKQAAPGTNVNLDVEENVEAVSGKIEEFVNAMNGTLGFIQSQSRLDANSDTSRTLGGDSLIRSAANRFRRALQAQQFGVSGEIKRLNQIGIEYNRNGTIQFEKAKFDEKLQADPESVEAFFTGDGFTVGFIPTMRNSIGTMLNPSFGPIVNRKNGLQQRIDQTDRQIERKQTQLARREQTLRRQFSRLEETMSRLKSQGSQLSALGGGGLGGLNLGGASAG